MSGLKKNYSKRGGNLLENKVVLYTTGCPRCTVLKNKLNEKSISYETVESIDEMTALGIMQVPVLGINGKLHDFTEAVQWVNKQ